MFRCGKDYILVGEFFLWSLIKDWNIVFVGILVDFCGQIVFLECVE